MKDNHTDITLVLDRSGSMLSVVDDTIGGVNTFIADQKKAPGTAAFTLNQFDGIFEHVVKAESIQSVNNLNRDTFKPRGSTALLDAIGRSINETGKRIEAMPETERPSKVVFVIVTDGHENASREFDQVKIDAMIRHQREKYQWEFVYLGANQDAIASAAKIGINNTHAMTYAHTGTGTRKAFAAVAANLTAVRSRSADSMAYSVQQRKEQDEEL